MIYDPDQGIRVLKGNTWSLAGENPVTLLNEVTPIVRMKRERDKLHDC